MRARLEPRTGMAFQMRRGQHLRLTDPEGEQVADLLAFNAADHDEILSSGRTLDYAGTLRISRDHLLYSNRSSPMLTVVEDSVGRHDFLLTPCSPETFRLIYGYEDHRPSCYGNLVQALAPYRIPEDRIATTFNAFMNVEIAADGTFRVMPPLSRPGDHITFRAEMDLLVAVTACSAEQSNNYRFKPIDVEVTG